MIAVSRASFSTRGVVDSKRISSDARIRALADTIRKTSQGLVEMVLIGPAKYNELYEKFGNLNRLLGWGHARVIENLLARKPGCPRSLSDQFADARVIKESLMRHGRNIVLEQRPRAESDIAVAAASIIAREGFINWLERKGKELGMRLERGVSPGVKETAKKLVELNGPQALREVAKVHFRTAHEIAPQHYAAPPAREDWRHATLADFCRSVVGQANSRETLKHSFSRYAAQYLYSQPRRRNAFATLSASTARFCRDCFSQAPIVSLLNKVSVRKPVTGNAGK